MFYCPRTEITTLSYPIFESRVELLFELVHADVWGLYQRDTHDTMRFFLIIVNDYFQNDDLGVCHFEKFDNTTFLKTIADLVGNQFGINMKRFKSNNDGEFFNDKLCTF